MKATITYQKTIEIELPTEFDKYTSLIDRYNKECLFGNTIWSQKDELFVMEAIQKIDSYLQGRIYGDITDLQIDDPSFNGDSLVMYEDGEWECY